MKTNNSGKKMILELVGEHLKKKRISNISTDAESIDIRDLEGLKLQIDNIPEADHVALNMCYGHLFHMKKYAGIPEDAFINAVVNHGLYIHSISSEKEFSNHSSNVLVPGALAKGIVEKNGKNALMVGPYIAYADGYYTGDRFKARKKELGRVLLAFPIHPREGQIAKYDFEQFEMVINDISDGFDTVMVCLSRIDLRNGYEKKYKNGRFIVVSAGVDTDKFFLPRQRSILELSDAVVSNGFSTGLIYALFLKKPVYVFRQRLKYDGNYSEARDGIVRDFNLQDLFIDFCQDKTFNDFQRQYLWAANNFGFNETKSPDELYRILTALIRK